MTTALETAIPKLRLDRESKTRLDITEYSLPQHFVTQDPDTGAIGRPYSDAWNSERFAAEHKGSLRYVHDWKQWLCWDGKRWQPDRSGYVMRCARATIDGILDKDIIRDRTESDKRDLARHYMKSLSLRALEAVVRLAQSEEGMSVVPDDLDSDPWILNCSNGTLDLRTGILHEHRAADLCTKLVPVAFDAGATSTVWDAFLERIFDGDSEMIGYMRRAIGYSLTGSVKEHVLHACWGIGANGKSTMLNSILGILGDYGQTLPADALLRRRVGSATNDIAGVRGVRFAVVMETPEGARLNEPLVKQLTGGDRVRARAMYKEFEEFEPVAKYWIVTNRKPAVSADDEALWRRLRLAPFTQIIPPGEQDQDLPDKLRLEWPGILAWAVRGCMEWQANGLGSAQSVREATAGYRVEMDAVARFIAETFVRAPGASVRAGDLEPHYKAWAEATGEKPLSQTLLGQEFKRLGYEKQKGAAGYRYLGIGLREDDPEQGSPEAPGAPFAYFAPFSDNSPLATPHEGGYAQTVQSMHNYALGDAEIPVSGIPAPQWRKPDPAHLCSTGCGRPSMTDGSRCFRCVGAA